MSPLALKLHSFKVWGADADYNAIAAILFGLVQCVIGKFDKLILAIMIFVSRDTRADGDSPRVFGKNLGELIILYRLADFFGYRLGVGQFRIRQDYGKLFTAVSANHIHFPGVVFQQFSQFSQQLIPG